MIQFRAGGVKAISAILIKTDDTVTFYHTIYVKVSGAGF